MSSMWFFRYLALGFLSAAAVAPVMWIQRGDELEHMRLAALIGFDLAQFLTVPIALAIGIYKVLGAREDRPPPSPPGLVLGSVTAAFGAVLMTQAIAATRWVDGRSSGIGDPDGESVMAAFAVLSGATILTVGATILLTRRTAIRRTRTPAAPAATGR
ncbi:hypothetical protein [Sphaerisporangium sp. NPDC051011]|uniref:hypothetical protein n=1 Tax=Sphaerisporangium sp. NPDC051011 TaxID=3155792 RepID=UPI00340F3CE7